MLPAHVCTQRGLLLFSDSSCEPVIQVNTLKKTQWKHPFSIQHTTNACRFSTETDRQEVQSYQAPSFVVQCINYVTVINRVVNHVNIYIFCQSQKKQFLSSDETTFGLFIGCLFKAKALYIVQKLNNLQLMSLMFLSWCEHVRAQKIHQRTQDQIKVMTWSKDLTLCRKIVHTAKTEM